MPRGVAINTHSEKLSFKLSARFIGYRNFFKSKHNALWLSCLQNLNGKVFFDVGAHIGLYTLPASKIAKKIVAFEPSLFNLAKLRHHLVLNNVTNNVVVVPMAVSNVNGTLDFFESSNGSHPKNSLLMGPELGVKRSVEATTLDSYCEKNALYPDVLKIDVEGAEFYVLEGAKKLLSTKRPIIYLSLHPSQIKNLGFEMTWLSEFASQINYGIVPENFIIEKGLQEVQLTPNEWSQK